MTQPDISPEPPLDLESEIRMLKRLLRDADARKQEALVRLAAGICHDMNNFLTPVLAYSSMIKEDLPKGHPSAEFVDEIIQATEKSQTFMKMMQDVRGKGQFGGGFDMNAAVEAALNEIKPELPNTVQLTVELDTRAGEVTGERSVIARALRELVDNAVKAMPVGGTIAVATQLTQFEAETPMDGGMAPAGRYVALSVRDQGTGMSDDVRARLYEPYFSGRPPGHGKGLGLAVTKGLIAKCNGFIRCTTAIGAGTAFDIFLRPYNYS